MNALAVGVITLTFNPLFWIACAIAVWVAYRDMNRMTPWPAATKRRVIVSVAILVVLAVLTPTAWAAMVSDRCGSGGGDWGWLGFLAGCW